MKTTASFPAEWVPLFALPIPPMLETALGYHGAGRYVAFWWDPRSNELGYSDGLRTQGRGEWYGWLLYSRHRAVAPHLLPFPFGGTGGQPGHALLLDRWERCVAVGPYSEITAFLERQLLQQLSEFLPETLVFGRGGHTVAREPAAEQAHEDLQHEHWQSLNRWLDELANAAGEARNPGNMISVTTLKAF